MSSSTPTRPIAGIPLNSPKSAAFGSGFPATAIAISASPKNMTGLTATSHQRTGTRHRIMRASRSRSPGRPIVQAVGCHAAIAGPSRAGTWVGQLTPRRTTSWAAAIGITHARLST